MIFMRWTGFGCLSPLLLIALFFGGVGAGWALTGGDDIQVAFLTGAGLMVLLAPLHWLLGLALNSKRTPSGRRWHDEHTYFDQPVQYGFVPQLVFALIIGSIALGQLTSPLYGWLMFVGVPVAALVAYGLLDKERRLGPVSDLALGYTLVMLVIGSIAVGQLTSALYGWLMFGGALLVALMVYVRIGSRRQLRSVADRREFAAGRGWLYKNSGGDLTLRWRDLFGKKAFTIGPFGILGGEVEGLPFTAFDSEPGGPETRRTYWAVHLPVAYPRVQVLSARGSGIDGLFSAFASGVPSATPDDLRAETADAAFGQALLTPQVRSATVAFGLVGWRIEGRDLLLVRSRAKPHTADEVAQVAAHLAGLARQLPADLASRFGAPPSTDIPLRMAGAA
ncbi:hypothetical protein [Planotetraspora phitsanulokensis]|uniref:Uncharacterized protein n=1 Tax=Planotetraspora phitsanulokensis TaxID=575192 RepID=A0A8J3UCK9_9ACTN|nr:hypothetical protein [Planotetraspora phitsanulokensis]GII42026.1 hypothetical protein Pph01_70290 [Planotetraspora phitsanulokensis]